MLSASLFRILFGWNAVGVSFDEIKAIEFFFAIRKADCDSARISCALVKSEEIVLAFMEGKEAPKAVETDFADKPEPEDAPWARVLEEEEARDSAGAVDE